MVLQLSLCAVAQQTLGGITGTVSDKSGSVLPDTTVTIVGDQTKLTRTLKTNGNGAYDFVNLPIGTYTLTVTHDGFQTRKTAFDPGAGGSHRHAERHPEGRPGGHHHRSARPRRP